MAKDLVLDVIAKKNSRELSALADEFDRLARETDDFGAKLNKTGSFSQYLEDQLGKTRTQVKQLGDEFDKTGNKDVYAKLRGAQSNLNSLERIKKDLAKSIEDGAEEGGKKGGERGGTSFLEAFKGQLGPALIGNAIVAAFAAAPGAILAGAGLAGIGLGIVGQLSNPEVKAAAQQAGHDIMAELAADTAPFAQPIENALGTLGQAAKQALGSVDFATLARDVEPFATALGALVDEIMPGFNKLLAAAEPVLQEFEHDLTTAGGVGDSLSTMFELIANSGEGATQSMRFLMAAVGGAALAVGLLVDTVSHVIGVIAHAADVGTEWVKDLTSWIPGISSVTSGLHDMANYFRFGDADQNIRVVGRSFTDLGGDVTGAKNAVSALTTSVRNLSAAFDDYFGKQMTADEAATKFATDIYGLKGALDSHTKSLSLNSAAGAANRQVILGAIQDAKAHRDALIAQAGGANASKDAIAAADRVYEADIAKLRQMATNAGIAANQFDALAGTYNVNINVNLNKTAAQLNAIGDLQSRLGRAGSFAEGGIRHAAAGMLIGPSDPGTLVGEPQTGGEALIPLRGISAGRAAWLGQAALSGYGLDVVPRQSRGAGMTVLNLTVNAGLGTDGYAVGKQIAEVLRPYVRGRGGDVQVALGT